MDETKRNRKKNFTHDEIMILLEGYKENQCILESKFNSIVTNRKKNDAWTKILNKINAKGCQEREIKEIKKKWSDLKTQAVEDYPRTKNFPTGGGPRPEPGPYSTIIIDIIGEDSATVSGISGGGVESGKKAPPTPKPSKHTAPPTEGKQSNVKCKK